MTDATLSPAAHRFDRDGNQSGKPQSLAEVNSTIAVPQGGLWLRRLLAFSGPGYMISVGYMDPGNWATDIAGGSQFGYTLLSVILLSNMMAILLQALSARLGIATGRDLAQMCRESFSRPVNLMLWIACELAIIACDLAEVIGTAIALKLLFGIPLLTGALIAALDAFLVLLLMNKGFRFLEAFVIALLIVIATCFAIQIAAASPPVAAVLKGFLPSSQVVTNPQMLYIAIGIIGATVMPHNLYLHSSIIQTRAFERTHAGRRQAIRWATVDSTIALSLALFVNAAILIVAASVFHANGKTEVKEIEQAYELLSPVLGLGIASYFVRRGLAGIWTEFDRHSDVGRADCDGGLPTHPPAELGETFADARAGDCAGHCRDGALRGERHRAVAHFQSGGVVTATPVCCHSVDLVCEQPAEDGRTCYFAIRGRVSLGCCGGDRDPECEAFVRYCHWKFLKGGLSDRCLRKTRLRGVVVKLRKSVIPPQVKPLKRAILPRRSGPVAHVSCEFCR